MIVKETSLRGATRMPFRAMERPVVRVNVAAVAPCRSLRPRSCPFGLSSSCLEAMLAIREPANRLVTWTTHRILSSRGFIGSGDSPVPQERAGLPVNSSICVAAARSVPTSRCRRSLLCIIARRIDAGSTNWIDAVSPFVVTSATGFPTSHQRLHGVPPTHSMLTRALVKPLDAQASDATVDSRSD